MDLMNMVMLSMETERVLVDGNIARNKYLVGLV